MKNIIKKTGSVLLMALALTGCSQFSDDSNPYDVAEAVKSFGGVWKLKSVTRNNIDITADMDFSKFELHMGDDGRYHIENYLPFVVEKDGTWHTDDPLYPFQLSFLEDGAASSVDVNFNFPVVNGQRSLLITLSPGCASNVYTYTLERTDN
ncbi:DUF5004 domain-containing protein [Xylanibacter brevis]|jgi:hypothetical protein|uniref:DUF5004 domain-containing protein n=1 Tax=Xylanibacter brevis TaxID=83231 RepID=UPI00048733A6|nr:DUF5004 domain-containing protein [Xylanibacter brevis]